MSNRYLNRREEGWIGIALICLVALILALWIAVDQGLMTRHSERFSREAFTRIERGMTLPEAVDILGPPVRSKKFDPATRHNPASDAAHYFSVPAVDWWPVYTKAWVVTDQNEEIIVVAIADEP